MNTKEKGGRFNSTRATPRIKTTPKEAQEHKEEDHHEHKIKGGFNSLGTK
jgi:hypothetical protein